MYCITKLKPQARLFNIKKFRQTLAAKSQLTQFVDVAVDTRNGGKIQTLLANALRLASRSNERRQLNHVKENDCAFGS